jgi:phage terminase large subunit-like protein
MLKNMGNPTRALCAVAPTSLMRTDNKELLVEIELERQRDPENAAREFDCDVSAVLTGTFFDAVSLEAAIDETIEPLDFRVYPVAVACDFAFKRDSCAICVVQWDGHRYNLIFVEEIVPEHGKPLKPSAVVKKFAEITKWHGASYVITDGHYREAVKEHLSEFGLSLVDAPGGITGKMDVYTRTKAVLDEGMVGLPDHKRLIAQAKQIVSRPTSGGLIQIKAPRRTGGGHGDLVSAWTLAVHHLAYARTKHKKIKPRLGEPGYWEYIRKCQQETEAKMEAADLAEATKSVGKKGHWRFSN